MKDVLVVAFAVGAGLWQLICREQITRRGQEQMRWLPGTQTNWGYRLAFAGTVGSGVCFLVFAGWWVIVRP